MRYFIISQKFNKLSINQKLKKNQKSKKLNLVSPFKLLYIYIY